MPIQILEDLTKAMEDYPHVYLTLEFVEVDIPGTKINKNDDVQFRIQIKNAGPLDVNQLSLLVEGLNGTQVKSNGAAAVFGSSFTLNGSFIGNIAAHSADNAPVVTGGNKFHFKPTNVSSSIEDLVRVSVAGWDTTLNHQETAHTRADPAAEATFSSVVEPV
jgi:hypothetical protein